MITIVEPKEAIDKLWGKQKVRESDTYRLMRYVLRVDHEGKVLLHNCVTGRLVVLDEAEAALLDKLPAAYDPAMEALVTEHYLVPETFDEHGQVVNLRNILWKLSEAHKPKEVTSYMILPTTACNARCWYCYEKGIEAVTMTEETANDVVDFIERNCGGKGVRLWWIGGEPTLASDRIDQICRGLKERGVKYVSQMTTNGYLFDDEMVERAKELWHMIKVSISMDGTEVNYNRVKAFQGVKDNPYQRVMNNAGKLMDTDVFVALRMNFDQENYRDFPNLLMEAKSRFSKSELLSVYPHQINWDFPDDQKCEAEKWFSDKIVELNDLACSLELNGEKGYELPCLHYEHCGASNGKWFAIHPSGNLVSCGEQLSKDQYIGDLKNGITNTDLVLEWQRFADYEKCQKCVFFPWCCRTLNCAAGDRCYYKKDSMLLINDKVRGSYRASGLL